MQFRQILRALGKTPKGRAKLSEVLFQYRHKFSDREFWLIKYTYLEKLSVMNVSEKLSLSRSHYHSLMNSSLSKFETLVGINGLLEFIKIV